MVGTLTAKAGAHGSDKRGPQRREHSRGIRSFISRANAEGGKPIARNTVSRARDDGPPARYVKRGDLLSRLHLGGRDRNQFVHLAANRLLGEREVLGGEIGNDLAQDVTIAGFLEIGRDHVLDVGRGGIA